LMSQMMIPRSTYQIWQNSCSHFSSANLFGLTSYPRSAFIRTDGTIAHTCTGHLPNTDRIMYGWADKVSTIRVSGKPVQLSDFFSHIRKRVFVRRVTHHAALLELRLL
jgi:hypothetical protein